MTEKTCSGVSECGKSVYARGICLNCYQREHYRLRPRLQLQLEPELKERVRAAAGSRGATMNGLIRAAILRYLEEEK